MTVTIEKASEGWREACLYEVNGRSLAESDGDGDLRGLLGRLDCLAGLGIDTIWLTPAQPSPMSGSGFDISDDHGNDPRFGTLDDFRAIVARVHDLRLRMVLDQVYSHSSHMYPWFIDSASSRDDPSADRYDLPDHHGRDGARTPMTWHPEGILLGFSNRDGWLPAEQGHTGLSVCAQKEDPTSSLALRQSHPALQLGNLALVDSKETPVIMRRSHGVDSLLCAFYWGQDAIPLASEGLFLAGAPMRGKSCRAAMC